VTPLLYGRRSGELAKALGEVREDNPEFSLRPVWSKAGDYGQEIECWHHAVEEELYLKLLFC